MEYAFITGMGRSGTKFLTSVLGSIPNVHAVHEHIGNREYWLLSWYLHGNVYATPYLQRKKQEIEKKFSNGLFIDVNGYLQNSVPEVSAIFKPKMVFHFVRDPREVVRSLYTRRNDREIHLIPKNTTEVEQWLDGDKFSQICWNWASTTEQLLNCNTELILFEKVKSDYTYFSEKILKPLNISLSEAEWEKARNVKVNKTQPKWYRWIYAKLRNKKFVEDLLPPYSQWSDLQKQQFEKICGPVMIKCGYKI